MSVAVTAPVGPVAAQAKVCRVLLCDDSVVIRSAIARILEGDPQIRIVGSVANGQLALDMVRKHEIDVVVLDIEMPVMDGVTALPLILKARPGVRVLMASTLTRRNAAISIKALTLGATDYIPKPDSTGMLGADAFGQDLVAKIKAIGLRARPGPAAPGAASSASTAPPELKLRPKPAEAPKVLVVGSSTGGPQALDVLLGQLGNSFSVPILIVQHMPPTFTALLAESLTKATGVPCTEARDGEPALAGRAYIAPGDYHMTVEGRPEQARLRVYQGPPENFVRPAVDPLLRGAAEVYGRRTLAVILTGMGSDGCKGCEALVAAGGAVYAQDEATSVVWGMPGAVARTGLCSGILPITRLGNEMRSYVKARST
ncbi:MAG: chemotaxis response regulator protein-glutamate methylesterase [Alphaproteobacteria bacterium]